MVCTAIIGSLHNLWCGLLLYPQQRQCEKPHQQDKAISSHTLFFYPLLPGNWRAQQIYNMWIFLILLVFAIGGAILGALSGDKEGAASGCLAGLFTGGSCLVQIFIAGISIFITIWLFGLIFG